MQKILARGLFSCRVYLADKTLLIHNEKTSPHVGGLLSDETC